MNSASVTKSLHTRFGFVTAIVVAVLFTGLAYLLGSTDKTIASEGLIAGWGNSITLLPEINLGVAVLLNGLVTALLLHLNKTYHLLRSMTMLQGTFFLTFILAFPSLLYSACSGTLLCLTVIWCVGLLYRCYGTESVDTRKVFLTFVLLSAGTSFDVSFLVYIPILILACVQLRLISLRTCSAIILGLITPWILILGFGLADIHQIQWPEWDFTRIDLSITHLSLSLGTGLFTVCVAIAALLQNAIKYITYNIQARSMIGVINTLTVATSLVAIVDYGNLYSYLALLISCSAFQAAHLFAQIHNFAKSYLAILSIILIYIFIYVWNLSILIL